MSPTVSVVIPTFNRGDLLCETMRMALAQDYQDFEVIVVDQTANVSPAVKAFVESADFRLRYHRLDAPNLPAARNVGVRLSRGEIIVFVDDDVILEPDYVASHVRCYSDETVGAVAGVTLPVGEYSESAVIAGTLTLLRATSGCYDGTAKVEWVVGCNCSFRRKAIIDAGMSDERFTGSGWGEDVDLALRVSYLGYSLVFDPRVRLVHLALTTGGCENRNRRDDNRVKDERCRLSLFLWIKNRVILGPSRTLANIWSTYRQHALNRVVVRSPGQCAIRQSRFAWHLCHAVLLCRRDGVSPRDLQVAKFGVDSNNRLTPRRGAAHSPAEPLTVEAGPVGK